MPYDISYIWNLKYDINGLIFETETDTQKTSLPLPVEKGSERCARVWD